MSALHLRLDLRCLDCFCFVLTVEIDAVSCGRLREELATFISVLTLVMEISRLGGAHFGTVSVSCGAIGVIGTRYVVK